MQFKNSRIPGFQIGRGAISNFESIADQFPGKRCLVVTGRSFLDKHDLYEPAVASFTIVKRAKVGFEPTAELIDQIVTDCRDLSIDVVLGIGGGSVIDAAKAVSAMLLETGSIKNYLEGVGDREPSGKRLPLLAIPTTSGTGSEATKNAVISSIGPQGFKKSLRHDNYIPDHVIIDSDYLVDCPLPVTAASGMDAITQLFEAYISSKATPYTDSLAYEGLKYGIKALPIVMENPENHEARLQMGYAGFLSGIVLANAGLGIVHGFASPLGALREIPHGVVCATLLYPSTQTIIDNLLKNAKENTTALTKMKKAGLLFTESNDCSIEEGCEFLLNGLKSWQENYEIPPLSQYGFTKQELIEIASTVSQKNTPVELSEEDKIKIVAERY